MGNIDVTGVFTLIELSKMFEKQGIKLVLTGRTRRIVNMLDGWATREEIQIQFYPTRRGALAAFYENLAQQKGRKQENISSEDVLDTQNDGNHTSEPSDLADHKPATEPLQPEEQGKTTGSQNEQK